MVQRCEALVIGAGVIGATTALRLLESGWRVRVYAEAVVEGTTSLVSAAIWRPFRADPQKKVLAWGRRTAQVFAGLAGETATGVTMREGLELSRAPITEPWWRSAVEGFRHARRSELPPGYADALHYQVPVVEMPVFLRWLMDRVRDAGGVIERRTITSLEEAAAECPVVVNATGLGAGTLAGDTSVYPVRGQVVRVTNPGIAQFTLDYDHPGGLTYVVPRSQDCVLGGTAQDHCWDLRPDDATAEAILLRCRAVVPALAGATVLEHAVGLRPARPSVRVERVRRPDGGVLVHNYGHGGSGVTVAWGCADEVMRLLAS